MKDKWDNLPKPLITHLGNICVEQTVVAVVIPVVKPTVRAWWPSLDHVIYSQSLQFREWSLSLKPQHLLCRCEGR